MKRVPVIESHPWQPNVLQIRNSPPTPVEGARYIVGTSPSGVWTLHANLVATRYSGMWLYDTPQKGWKVYVENVAKTYVYDGNQWVVDQPATAAASHNVPITSDGQTTFTVPQGTPRHYCVLNGVTYYSGDYTLSETTLTWADAQLETDDQLILNYLP